MERVVIVVVVLLAALTGLRGVGEAAADALVGSTSAVETSVRQPWLASARSAALFAAFGKVRQLSRALAKTHPHLPRAVRVPLAKWIASVDTTERSLVLGRATLPETLSAWFFADGLPFADRGLTWSDAEFAAAQKAWRLSTDADAPSIAIRATHEKSLQTGRRTVAYVDGRLRQLGRANTRHGNELQSLRRLTHDTLRDFDAALSADALSKSDVLKLAESYIHAVDLRPAAFDKELRSRLFIDREMPFFTASAQRWSYHQLYGWFLDKTMPRELPHPYKNYDGKRRSVARYKAFDDQHLHDAERRGAFPSSAPRAKRQELWFYIENAADIQKRDKARIVHALRKWKGRAEADRILASGLEQQLQLRPGILLIDELEGWMAQGW